MKLPVAVAVATLFASGVASAAPATYKANLLSVNGSGVTGTATATLDGSNLTLTLHATGLVANQLHPSHIHGLLGANAPLTTLAPPSADLNHDGFVETPEGALFEGPPIYDLPPTGVPGAYGTAPGGVLDFTQSFNLADPSFYDPEHMGLSLTLNDILGLTGGNTTPLVDRLIELHGMMVPAGIDGTTGPAGTLVYDPEMPVAGGMFRLVAVPEPGTLMLLGMGVLGLVLVRRRSA